LGTIFGRHSETRPDDARDDDGFDDATETRTWTNEMCVTIGARAMTTRRDDDARATRERREGESAAAGRFERAERRRRRRRRDARLTRDARDAQVFDVLSQRER